MFSSEFVNQFLYIIQRQKLVLNMAKEEVTIKAPRRKVTTKSEADSANSLQINDVDYYSKTVAYENDEASKIDPDEGAKLCMETCQQVKEISKKIAALRFDKSKNSASEIKELQSAATVKIMYLKKLNRLEKVRTKECRQVLQKYREQVDADHLQLQNLVYEQLHLSKEVAKCHQFKSIDEDLDLISVEEFYATAPSEISKPEITKENLHQLKLARLTWELMQRKEIAKQIKQLEKAKEAVVKKIESKKEQLNNLGPQLKTLLDATIPLQDSLNIPIDKTKRLHDLALQLPKPLYILFVQADAFSDIAKWLKVTINGKTEEATLEEQHFDEISSDSDSDNEGDLGRRRKIQENQDRRKSGSSRMGDQTEARREECLRRHNLTVDLQISLSKETSIILHFQWLTTLETVCVLTSVSTQDGSGIAAGDLLSPSLFSALFPGDSGELCPNPATFYHLKRAGLDGFPSDMPGLGIPYQWAQAICGVSFLLKSISVSVSTCQHSLEATLCAVRQRLKKRISLAREIQLLESGEALKDKKLQSSITSLLTISTSDMERVVGAVSLFESNVIDSTFLFYRIGIEVYNVKFVAYVAVPPNYPETCPIFIIEVLQKNALNSVNCEHVRDLEREVNVFNEEEEDAELLLGQVYKLLLCCEVFSSTELGMERQVKATLFRSVQGRTRSHPYHYVPTAGGIFTHR